MDLSKIKIVEFFKPKNWMSVIRSFFNMDVYQGHIIEQLMFRRIECRPCVLAGSCEHCGCTIGNSFSKMADLKASCSGGKWGPVMSAKEWEAYKAKFNINFSVTYNF